MFYIQKLNPKKKKRKKILLLAHIKLKSQPTLQLPKIHEIRKLRRMPLENLPLGSLSLSLMWKG
jgi:hypothetical protein